MFEVHASTDVGGLLRYLRGHAECTAFDARRDPELARALLSRCFGSGGRGFHYRKDPPGTDKWYNFQAALDRLVCRAWTVSLDGEETGPICEDCEDQASHFAAAADVLECFAWVQVGIVPPPHEGADGHAICRVGELIAQPPAGLTVPGPGLWDPCAWSGMRAPDPALYGTAQFLTIRRD